MGVWTIHGRAVLALTLSAALCGCGGGKNKVESRRLQPADFAAAPAEGEPGPAQVPPADVTATDPAPMPQAASDDSDDVVDSVENVTHAQLSPMITGTGQRWTPGGPITADAMVGQVNGRAIYASQVLAPIAPQLRQLGQSVSRGEFARQARSLISGTLIQIVTDALILGEAERNLTQQEQYGLLALLKVEREKLLNLYGQGARSVAEHRILEETSRTLDQAVEDKRAQLIVQRHMQQKLIPKINVTRKDIRRYYADHYDQFNPPVTRTIRLIVATTTQTAANVEKALADGASFVEVARGSDNVNRPERGGLFLENAEGDVVFGDARDQALAKLKAGEHSPRIEIGGRSYWIYVESLQQKARISLTEAAPEIEKQLRVARYQQLQEEYRRELFRRGSYAPLDNMASQVLEVALSKFAAPLPQ